MIENRKCVLNPLSDFEEKKQRCDRQGVRTERTGFFPQMDPDRVERVDFCGSDLQLNSS
jgi:hypothetical protein